MGQNEINPTLKSVSEINLNCFKLITQIGEGSYGKVWKVITLKTRKTLALKEMSKSKILNYNMSREIFMEKDILSKIYHPSIINMYSCFQDKDNLYMVMDYSPFKDLRGQFTHFKIIIEDDIKFIAGCIILALNYIHSKQIIHKDIKPENLLFDEKGYVRLTDFGISKYLNKRNNGVFGTIGYFAPENFTDDRPLGIESDYFSLGVVLYELATGNRPFPALTKQLIQIQFENSPPKKVSMEQFGYSPQFIDFVLRLLEIDPEKRLGFNGCAELMNHPWFELLDWRHVHYKTIRSPFLNIIELNRAEKETNNAVNNTIPKQESESESTQSNSVNNGNNEKDIFKDYSFNHFINPNEIVFFGVTAKSSNNSTLKRVKKQTKIVVDASNLNKNKSRVPIENNSLNNGSKSYRKEEDSEMDKTELNLSKNKNFSNKELRKFNPNSTQTKLFSKKIKNSLLNQTGRLFESPKKISKHKIINSSVISLESNDKNENKQYILPPRSNKRNIDDNLSNTFLLKYKQDSESIKTKSNSSSKIQTKEIIFFKTTNKKFYCGQKPNNDSSNANNISNSINSQKNSPKKSEEDSNNNISLSKKCSPTKPPSKRKTKDNFFMANSPSPIKKNVLLLEKEVQSSCQRPKKNDSFRTLKKKIPVPNNESIVGNILANRVHKKMATFLNVRKEKANIIKGFEQK